MKIKQIHAHFLISIGNYSNERIGFTVDLEEDDFLDDVVSSLRKKAKELIGESADDLYEKKWQAERAFKELQTKLTRLRTEWDATAEFLKAQGINAQAPSMPQFQNLLGAATIELESVSEAEFADE